LTDRRTHDDPVVAPREPEGAGGAFLDVSERSHAEYRDERLDYAVQVSGIGFWYCDLPFDELTWDHRVKEHFWLPPDARVTLETFYDRIHPDDREPTRHAIETSIRERAAYDIDYRTVHPSTGEVKWVRALGGADYAPDGTPKRFDGVTVDVTARKLEQQVLAETLERERDQARLLQQVARVALTIHAASSLDEVLRVVTREIRTILGARRARTRLVLAREDGTTSEATFEATPWLRHLDRFHDGFRAHVRSNNRPLRVGLAEVLAEPGGQSLDAVEQLEFAGGWVCAPLIARNGRNAGWVELSGKHEGDFSETDQVVLEQLAHVASVAIENVRLYDELRAQDRRKDEFLATLAHELRNPLAPVRTGLSILRHTAGAQAHAMVDMMARQVGHMVRMVDDLLDVSRITRGTVELRPEHVDFRVVLESALETSRPLIEASGQELAVCLPKDPLPLWGDPTRLSQVLGNLLHNAVKYTPRSGQVAVVATREDTSLIVEVRDTGTGIPPDMLRTVFDMFTQIGSPFERAPSGLGIGLTLARRLVELHGGSIEASSAGTGQGSTFTVRLPLSPGAAAGRDTRVNSVSEHATQPLRVLVVDDNTDAAESLALLLELSGHATKVAHDGVEALALVDTFLPQLVFLDIGLPDLTGYEVAQRLRTRYPSEVLMLVAVTGWGSAEDRRRAHAAGFDRHVTKPMDAAEVRGIVQQAAELRRA